MVYVNAGHWSPEDETESVIDELKAKNATLEARLEAVESKLK